MSVHKNDILVGNLMEGAVIVTICGPLEAYANGLRHMLSQADFVTKAYLLEASMLIENRSFIAIEYDLKSQRITEQKVRSKTRDLCKDWVLTTTGYKANTGDVRGDYVDLSEESALATI